MANPLSPSRLPAAAENAYAKVFGDGVADLRPTPSEVIYSGPQRTVHRYETPGGDKPSQRTPVLLVPPLAAPATCFDLRRGCSLAEYLTTLGYPTYLVDYGRIGFDDRELGLEHWLNDVLPAACGVVLADSGADGVQLVGWSLGGVMSLLSVADGRVPAYSVSMFGSPFDFAQMQLMAPVRRLADLTGGALGTALYRGMGGVPSILARWGFQATSLSRQIQKPAWTLMNLDNREALAHSEAVDDLMANMIAYPGRTFGQLYHRFFRVNELSAGRLELSNRTIFLDDVRVPVLAIAGSSDVLAPKAAVHCIADILPHAPEIRLETVPGGHLGLLTGRSAERTSWRHLDEFLLAND